VSVLLDSFSHLFSDEKTTGRPRSSLHGSYERDGDSPSAADKAIHPSVHLTP